VKDAIIEFLRWIRESLKPVFISLFLSAAIFFLPRSWVSATGLAPEFQKYRFLALVVFIASCVWLISYAIETQHRSRKRKKYLRNLRQDQKEVLRCFMLNRKTTQAFSRSHIAIARDLERLGIVVESSADDGRGHPYFVIDAWVFTYLDDNPELVDMSPEQSQLQTDPLP
jgi:hypothetical protein